MKAYPTLSWHNDDFYRAMVKADAMDSFLGQLIVNADLIHTPETSIGFISKIVAHSKSVLLPHGIPTRVCRSDILIPPNTALPSRQRLLDALGASESGHGRSYATMPCRCAVRLLRVARRKCVWSVPQAQIHRLGFGRGTRSRDRDRQCSGRFCSRMDSTPLCRGWRGIRRSERLT